MLPDQTTFTPDTVTGKVRTRIVHLLLLSTGEAACRRMTASGYHSPKALRSAARLAALPEANDADNLSLLVEYLTYTVTIHEYRPDGRKSCVLRGAGIVRWDGQAVWFDGVRREDGRFCYSGISGC